MALTGIWKPRATGNFPREIDLAAGQKSAHKEEPWEVEWTKTCGFFGGLILTHTHLALVAQWLVFEKFQQDFL